MKSVLELHQTGIPAYDLEDADKVFSKGGKRVAVHTISGYSVDRKAKCRERVEQIATLVKDNKRVALDVLRGGKLDEFVRTPKQYARRKIHTFKSNKNRGKLYGDSKAFRQQQAEQDDEEAVSDSPESQVGENKAGTPAVTP